MRDCFVAHGASRNDRLVGTETEFKWSVSSYKDFRVFLGAAKNLGAVLRKPRKILNQDYYLDTPQGDFFRRKSSARLRHSGRSWEFTLKSASKLKKGLASRCEENIKLPGAASLSSALSAARGILSRRGYHAGASVIFRLKNHRTAVPLRLPGGGAAQATFDDVAIFIPSRTVLMREIELEAAPAKKIPEGFEKFCRALTEVSGLRPAKMSKVATARAALKHLR